MQASLSVDLPDASTLASVLGRTYERENCSSARALEVVGERWSLLLIRNAVFAGMTRFSEFERALGIAPNILAKRLDGFVAEGLMVLDDGAYRLTEKGRELGEVVMALMQWGDRWAAPAGPPILMQHEECGGGVRLVSTCDRCGATPALTELSAVAGPGADDRVRRRRARTRLQTSS